MFGYVTRTVIEISEKKKKYVQNDTFFFPPRSESEYETAERRRRDSIFESRFGVLLTQFDRRRSADDDRDDNAHKTAEDFPRASSHIVRFPVGEAKCVSALTTAADWTPLREQWESGRERVFLNRTIAIAVLPPSPILVFISSARVQNRNRMTIIVFNPRRIRYDQMRRAGRGCSLNKSRPTGTVLPLTPRIVAPFFFFLNIRNILSSS